MSFLGRGQSMPMNLIVIAILCLIVLAVVSWIFYNQMVLSNKNLNSCSNKKGVCMSQRDSHSCFGNETMLLTPDCTYYPASADKKEGQCCIPVFG